MAVVTVGLWLAGCNATQAVAPQPNRPVAAAAGEATKPPINAERSTVPAAGDGHKPGPDEPGYSPEMTSGAYDPYMGRGGGVHIEPYHQPTLLAGVQYVQSAKGDPAVVGCADGQREGFADVAAFADIAGCVGQWPTAMSLAAPPTGTACGDDLGRCAQPADVCAAGWHVCGSGDGDFRDLSRRVTADQCDAAGPGRFNAGFSHLVDDTINPCTYDEDEYQCAGYGRGAEPVCCGAQCEFGMCKDAVWAGRTRISRGVAEGCDLLSSARNGGVLCCASGA